MRVKKTPNEILDLGEIEQCLEGPFRLQQLSSYPCL